MNKAYITVLVAGLKMTSLYGFQWWQSSPANVTVLLAEIEGWNNGESEEPADLSAGRLVIPSIGNNWGADETTLDQGVGRYISEWPLKHDVYRNGEGEKRRLCVPGARRSAF